MIFSFFGALKSFSLQKGFHYNIAAPMLVLWHLTLLLAVRGVMNFIFKLHRATTNELHLITTISRKFGQLVSWPSRSFTWQQSGCQNCRIFIVVFLFTILIISTVCMLACLSQIVAWYCDSKGLNFARRFFFRIFIRGIRQFYCQGIFFCIHHQHPINVA